MDINPTHEPKPSPLTPYFMARDYSLSEIVGIQDQIHEFLHRPAGQILLGCLLQLANSKFLELRAEAQAKDPSVTQMAALGATLDLLLPFSRDGSLGLGDALERARERLSRRDKDLGLPRLP